MSTTEGTTMSDCNCVRFGCEHDLDEERHMLHAMFDRAPEIKRAICRQQGCPGSLGGDHDGYCPLFDPEV